MYMCLCILHFEKVKGKARIGGLEKTSFLIFNASKISSVLLVLRIKSY